MNAEQQQQAIALILAIGYDQSTDKQILQKICKGFLTMLPAEEVASAASLPIDFTVYPPAGEG